ncbi:hypothetical protein QOT17_002095 [Balamuthia mandrillaris]
MPKKAFLAKVSSRANPLGFNADPYSALRRLEREQLQARILDPSINIDTLQQESDDLTARFALVERTSALRDLF